MIFGHKSTCTPDNFSPFTTSSKWSPFKLSILLFISFIRLLGLEHSFSSSRREGLSWVWCSIDFKEKTITLKIPLSLRSWTWSLINFRNLRVKFAYFQTLFPSFSPSIVWYPQATSNSPSIPQRPLGRSARGASFMNSPMKEYVESGAFILDSINN